MSRTPTGDDAAILIELLLRIPVNESDLAELICSDIFWSASKLGPEQRWPILARAAVIMTFRESPETLTGTYRVFGKPIKTRGKRKADLVIVTVKPPELDAALMALGIDRTAKPDHSTRGARFWACDISQDVSSRPLNTVVTMCGTSGSDDIAAFVGMVFAEYEVRLCVLLGMAAGNKERLT
jgi:hypothetical protein